MDANAIVEKINQDAQAAASLLLEDAKKRADALKLASENRIEQQKQDALKRAKQDGELMRERMLRMAELEDKKETLKAKRTVIDASFESALAMLESEDVVKLSAFFKALAVEYAQGDEVFLLGDKNKAWFQTSFLNEVNDALKKCGKPGSLTLGGEAIPGVGFALDRVGTRMNCTLKSLLDQNRLPMETDVARVLFS